MAKFRTFGPAIHTTTSGYAVCPLLEVTDEPPAPRTTAVITFLVLDPDFQIVFEGDHTACIDAADTLELRFNECDAETDETASVPSGPS